MKIHDTGLQEYQFHSTIFNAYLYHAWDCIDGIDTHYYFTTVDCTDGMDAHHNFSHTGGALVVLEFELHRWHIGIFLFYIYEDTGDTGVCCLLQHTPDTGVC